MAALKRMARVLNLTPFAALALIVISSFCMAAEEAPSPDEVKKALHRAVHFFRTECGANGGYVFRVSADLSKREGEGKVSRTTGWIEPPGTPAVGMAYLEGYRLTNDPVLLEAALETADALIRGQLLSGGWGEFIDEDPQVRAKFAFRVDAPDERGRNNSTTFDDDKSQSVIRFLMQLDKTLNGENAALHGAVMFALEAGLKSQYPNGAWPQRFDSFPDPEQFPVLSARFPDDWPREFPGQDYKGFYTLNDNTQCDLISLMLDAGVVYGDERYRASGCRGGDFLLLAQLPEPQPGWAQQYNREMHPVWARKFEPPAVCGGESQQVMQTLLMLYQRTADPKYLEPIPRALAYYRRSLLPDGRLARFYELHTNRPLYFTKTYELTYSDADVPTHYGFKSSSQLDRIEKQYNELLETPRELLQRPESPHRPSLTPELIEQTTRAIDALDDRGAWVENGRMRYYGDNDETRRVIESSTFIDNIGVLTNYLAAASDAGQ